VKIAELMKQPAVFETRHRRKDGSIIEVEISSNGVALDGSPFLYNAARDISARKQIEARIQRLNRTHAMLSEINQAIVHEPEPQTLFTTACAIAVETGKFRMAWIGKVDTATQRLEPVAAAGVVEDYPKLTQIDLQDATRNDGPAGRCVRKGEPAVCNNIERDPAYRPWRDEALKRGYRSSAGFPLKLNGQVVGVFNFYASEPEFFDDEELRLLDDLAADISFALSVNESQARYKAIFENAPDAVFLLAADGEDQGRILACNHLAEQQRGFAPGELAGKNISELTTGNSAALVPGRVRRVAAGESMVFEVEHRRKDGSTFPVEVTCARMLVANRPCVIAFDRDISERQQALAALAESQLLYQSLVTQLPIGIFLKDQLGRYVFVNPAFCQIHSLPETAFLGKTVLEVAMNDRAKPQGSTSTAKYAITGDSHFQQIMLTGKPIQSDEEYELADGTMRHLSAMKFPILKADGRIAGIQAVIFDITERKRADEAHARLAMLVEQATESIVITDAKGIITYVNPAFEKTSGYASAEARGCVKSRPFV